MTSEAGWHAVALSRAIEPGSAVGIVLGGKEVVLWRDSAGAVRAWEDRCPHRGMRLSFGFVRGDRLGCLYHGWQFDGAGRCRAIPAHPDLAVPSTIGLTAFSVLEGLGMVWVSLAADPPPAFPAFDVIPVRELYLDRALDHAVARFAGAEVAGPAGLWRRDIEGDGMLMAGHEVDADHCALHLVALEGLERDAVGARLRLARWAERFRAGTETA